MGCSSELTRARATFVAKTQKCAHFIARFPQVFFAQQRENHAKTRRKQRKRSLVHVNGSAIFWGGYFWQRSYYLREQKSSAAINSKLEKFEKMRSNQENKLTRCPLWDSMSYVRNTPPKPCSHDLCMAWFFWNLKRKENSRFWAVWTAPNTGLSTFDCKFCLHSSAASRRTQRTTHQIQKKSKLRDKSLLFCAKRTRTARKTHAWCTQNATLSCH